MDTLLPDVVIEAESAHTIGCKSGRGPRVEVLGAERRRSWTAEQKREIVGESLGPELTPTEVARKHGISTGQLYTWRQQMVSVAGPVAAWAGPRFTAVELSPPSPAPTPPGLACPPAPEMLERSPGQATGLIKIVLPGGVSLRVDAQVDGRALRCVLRALDRR